MKKIFVFADFHCHPTLKTYGHTFENSKYGYKRRNIWFKQNNSFLRKLICQFVGLTKFSQADFTTLKQGNVKIVTASLYPFEKGFFINLAGRGSVSAFLANIITGISYYRIRNIQKHTNYFQDLEKEYLFLIEAVSNDNKNILFFPTKKEDFNHIENNKTAVVISIEGAHVFNSGLNKYGRETNENEVINNIKLDIQTVKGVKLAKSIKQCIAYGRLRAYYIVLLGYFGPRGCHCLTNLNFSRHLVQVCAHRFCRPP